VSQITAGRVIVYKNRSVQERGNTRIIPPLRNWPFGIIWQKNRFSHPNIAEVVYVQVNPTNGNKLDNVSKSCYLVLILDCHYKRLLLSLLSYPDVNAI
jgi:hypothetical protein